MPKTLPYKIVITLLPLIAGCSGDLSATVTGNVTLDGQSLPEGPRTTGQIVFFPVAGGPAAYGTVTTGGSYVMQTGNAKSLLPGEYQVTVRVIDIDPPPPGGYNDPPNSKPLTPARYQDRNKTDLQVQVKKGVNQIDLDLSST